ncbi:sugar phosphate isomerase/epimerase family protein [Egicoccus halophilus]|uniref:Xylose isomerase n=1 Tax=Egicoccus halophilus TaxID=1670830 RepID=A0A8J3ABP0_9ACTN|nr:sugar phosphate isomerase/epimerase family protein [Egicoccus halophilus]GGI03455.1 xylose isomerase [Egicoccus halophilus]
MSGLTFAYGTNGLSDHRLGEALHLLAEHGYTGVALTLDHAHLDPLADDLAVRVRAVRRELEAHGLAVAVETGGRFVLDPARKHEPTLLHDAAGRDRRLALLHTAIDVAAELGSDVVHLWSGRTPAGTPSALAWSRLVAGVADLLTHAERSGVTLAVEPEPGMLLDRLAGFRRLRQELGEHPRLGLTYDLGHGVCLEDAPVADGILAMADVLRHVQIEDMRRGVHEHLPFGEGELDLPAALSALHDIDYRGLVAVELPRHGHTAHTMVPQAIAALRAADREVARR